MVTGLTMVLMFIATIYGMGELAEKGKAAKVGETTLKMALTNAACISMAAMVLAYDAACLYVLTKVL